MCNTEQQNWWMVFTTWVLRKKKLNLPSLVYKRARDDMIEILKHFHSYKYCAWPENFRPRNRPSRKHDYQLVWKASTDGVRGLQAIFSTSEQSKPGMRMYMLSLSTHLKTNWMKRGRICQNVLWAGVIRRGIDLSENL